MRNNKENTEIKIDDIVDALLYLNGTDYIANKIIEYKFLSKELDKDYTETLKKREEAREVIRNYEEQRCLNGIKK